MTKRYQNRGLTIMSHFVKSTCLTMCMTAVVLSLSGCGKKPETAKDAVSNTATGAEKTNLKLGFIKLTDMVPLAIAHEKGYFQDEGLNVQLEAQSNWKVLYDRVAGGELDGAHMLAAMPLGAMTGITGNKEIIAPFTLSYNGAAITVSNAVWQQMKPQLSMENGKPKHPISAEALKVAADQSKASGKPFNLGMTFPVGTHNYMMRYWLAAVEVSILVFMMLTTPQAIKVQMSCFQWYHHHKWSLLWRRVQLWAIAWVNRGTSKLYLEKLESLSPPLIKCGKMVQTKYLV